MEWFLPSEITAGAELRRAVGGHPLVADILARRGLSEVGQVLAFLDPSRYTPAPPTSLPDLDLAAERLLAAIKRREHILVWGDFDVDGQTATALLVDALRHLGARVSYHIPHRLKHGHGVQPEVLGPYLEQDVDLVLTCDTGVAAHEAARLARRAGVPLLITDHHALPPGLPDAQAVVNPQRLPVGHPLRDLPGVGVTYKLIQQLYTLAGRSEETERFLDLVALGIVSDVAVQRHDTRYLLQLGIDRLRQPRRVGLQALMRAAGVTPDNLSADVIGYQVGPRLNALGRLDEARLAVELLTTDDALVAQQIASQLELLNSRRKQIEDQIYAAAQDQIAKDPSLLKFEVLVLGGEHWHPGVIGIVAARLVEYYERPVVLLAMPPGQMARGSARSVPGVDIGAAIAANADLLIGHGGHPGAAGLIIDPDLIPQLRRRLSTTVRATRDPAVVSGYAVDAVVALGDLSLELALELNRLAPFGAGNPPVLLMTPDLRLVSHATFGLNGRHRRLFIEDGRGVRREFTWWRGSDYPLPPQRFDLLYIPRVNDYRGRRSLQLEWVDSRAVPGLEIALEAPYRVIDLRHVDDPSAAIDERDALVWAEGVDPQYVPFDPARLVTRQIEAGCSALVIWTAPPGPHELRRVLEQSGARRVYLACHHVPDDRPQSFLRHLAGLVKYALRVYDGEVSVLRLAVASAQREITVRRGLEWLEAGGRVRIEWLDGDRARLSAKPDASHQEDNRSAILDTLQALLAEAAAYRAYLSNVEVEALEHSLNFSG